MNKNSSFKQTEIGLLPEDWEVVPFDRVLSGNIKHGVYKSKKYQNSAGTRILKMGVQYSNERIGSQEMERICLSANELDRFKIQEGDLIFSRTSMIEEGAGNVSIVIEHSDPIVFDGNLLCATLNREIADPAFYYYYFKTKVAKQEILMITTGTQSRNIAASNLAKVNVPLPDYKEQDEIANIFSILDAKIELNQKINKTLEAIGEAVFRRWFVDFEFPNEEGKSYKSSGGKMVFNDELVKEIPKSWKVKPIDKIADFLNGLALQKFPAKNAEEFLPVIKIRELRRGITESSDKASLNVPEEYVVNDGDVLFSWSGSLEVVLWGFGKGALNQHLFKVTSSKYPKWVFYYWILEYLPEYRLIAAGKATTMGHIKRIHLTNSLVVVPDEKTLERMDKLLGPIIEKIIATKIEARTLSQIRDSLLPKFMSGKIRVPIRKENRDIP